MNATFQDMQDDRNEKNGSYISDASSFDALLRSFEEREPFCFLLTGENGFTLTVSWSSQVGSVQFSSCRGEPPYLMAIIPAAAGKAKFVEFLSGGTPTPIEDRFCLPLDQIRKIVLDFLVYGTRPDSVEWEPI